jgi:hypothetical protein
MHCIGWLERFQRSDACQARFRGDDPAVFTRCRMRPFCAVANRAWFRPPCGRWPIRFSGLEALVTEGERRNKAIRRNARASAAFAMQQRGDTLFSAALSVFRLLREKLHSATILIRG